VQRRDGLVLDPSLNLVLVQIILVTSSASEEQLVRHGRKFLIVLLGTILALLEEAAERSETGSRANHDDGVLELSWEVERRLANKYRHDGEVITIGYLILEPVRANSLVNATTRRLVLDNDSGDVDTPLVNLCGGKC
jgi:hypothetical protein